MKYLFICVVVPRFVGCTTTKQVAATYWTQKSGTVVVHHVVGAVDHTEKLATKPLSADQVTANQLAPKGKYFRVIAHDAPFVPVIKKDASKPKKDAKKDPDGTKLAQVSSELRNLKSEVSSLKEQLAEKPAPSESGAQTGNPPQETAQQDADTPRLSQ